MEQLKEALEKAGVVPVRHPWKALSGGRTNQIWQVGQMVVKRYAHGQNPLFANDPKAEWSALQLLDGTGLAPKPLAQGACGADHYLVYGFCAGKVWKTGVAEPAVALRHLHSVPLAGDFTAAPDGSAALSRQTHGVLSVVGVSDRDVLAKLEPRGAVPPSGRQAFLHGDPVAANFIVGRATVLVDWQCPAIGDPVEDLSIFLSPAMQLAYRGAALSDAERAEFIASYGDETSAGRLAALAPWHHWRMAAYCAWKAPTDPVYAKGMMLELAALKQATEQVR